MQTFIPKYRETDGQAQRFLQDLNSMIQETQTNNTRDSSKNVRIDKFPTQPFDINLASIEAKKKLSNPLSVPQNQNFQSNNQRTFDINDFFPNNIAQVPSQGPYSQREMSFQTERANNKVGGHNPMKEMHNTEISMQKMQQELRGNQNYKPNSMNQAFEIPQLNNVIPSQRVQSVQPQQKIQYQQQRQPTNSWENFQQSQSAIQVPRLNPNGQVFVNAPVNNVEYAFPNPLQFNQMNLMAYNNQIGFDPQAIPTFQPQEFQVYVINPEYQINQSQQQVYLVSQSPQLGFWQPTNQPQQTIFDNSQPVRTILQPSQIAQPIGNSHQQFAQTQLMPQNLQFIPPLQVPQNHQSNNYIQQGNQMNSYKTQPQPTRSEMNQKQVQSQSQLQPQSQSQSQPHHQQHHQQKQQQQQQQQKQMKQLAQHQSLHEESKLGHYQQQVSHKQTQQVQKLEPKSEPKPSKQQNQVEGLFCIPAFPGLSQLEKVQPETQKVDNVLSLEEKIAAEFLKQLELEMQQDSNLSHLESIFKSNLVEQQTKVNKTAPQIQPFHIERKVKVQSKVVEKEKEKEKEKKKEEEHEEEEIVEPQIEEMFETVQKEDEIKEDKKVDTQEKMETEETNEPASNEQENIEPEPKQDTPKKKSIIKNKEKRKQKKKRVENKLENKIENKEEQKPESAKEEPEKMEIDQANLTSTVSSTPDNSMPIPIPESTKKTDPKKQNWSYEEVSNAMKYLSEFDWLEEKAPGHKFLLSKLLAPPVFWFLVCSEYFPRRNFAGKDAKQLIQETIDKVHSVMPTFTQRILKEHVNPDSIQSSSSTETDISFLANLSQKIKDFVSQNDYERDLENISSNTALAPLHKNTYTEEDDQWLLEMRHYILDSFKKLEQENDQPKMEDESLPNFDVLTKIELDDLIALYEKDLSGLAHENFRNQTELENKMTQIPDGAKMVNNLRFDSGDMLADITISFPDEEEELLGLMERKQNDVKAAGSDAKPKQTGSKTLQKSRGEPAPEDIVCQVCNDGDFTDNDLIVFCAKCNVSVHQKCYGIVVLPEDDWICDLCINFGPSGKYLRCPLCDKRGGAMKPSPTKVDTELFVYTNPSYHSFLRSYAKFGSYRGVDHKPLSFKDLKRKSGHSKMLKQNKDEDNLDELDYNFHELAEATFTPEELKYEPKPFNVWVHLTCIKFIPEVFFGDRIHVTNILGFDKVGKERFKSECEVCKKKNNGATITCRKEFCTRGFHPECARRAGYYLDMKENSTNQMQCHIYCNKHTPLQLKRTLETKEKKKKDDIVKFFKQVEKSYFAHFNDIDRYGLGSVTEALNFEEEKVPIKKNKSIKETGGGDIGAKRREEGYFMKLVENHRKKTSRTACVISLETEGEVPEDQTPPYKIIEIKPPLDKDRELKLGDVVWEAFSYKGLTPKQKYKKYKEIVKRKAAEAALNEHIEHTEKEKAKEQVKEAEEPVLSQENKDNENKMEEIPVTTEKIVETPTVVPEKPVTPVIQAEEEQKMAEIENPVEPEASPVKEQKAEERPKFIIKLMKTSFLASFMNKDGPKLPFSPDYLTGSLLIDDMMPHKEDLICVCQKPYRGEIILGCAHCKDIFHPGCVEQCPGVNSTNWSCKTCENSRMQTEEEGLAETEYSESLTSLVGKRPNSNSGSEEEPNPRKKINFGLNGLGYY